MIDQQLLDSFQGIYSSIDSMRRAILTVSRQQLTLLQLLANLQLQTELPSLNSRVERFLSSIIKDTL